MEAQRFCVHSVIMCFCYFHRENLNDSRIYIHLRINLASAVITICSLPYVVQFSSSSDLSLSISSSDDDLAVTIFEILGLRTGLFDTLVNCNKLQFISTE